MNQKDFRLRIDSTNCTSMIAGTAFLGKDKFEDTWWYRSLEFESGKIYALISEYGKGCRYLSYLLGGRVDFEDLKVYLNENEVLPKDLSLISWNLEASGEKYGRSTARKAIEQALSQNNSKESLEDIQQKFLLTKERLDVKLSWLSGERWRASAALGYAKGKKIFFSPYETSAFYNRMCGSCLIKALRELTTSGAIVFLAAGSDYFVKHIVDECVYLDKEFDIDGLKKVYQELFHNADWIH